MLKEKQTLKTKSKELQLACFLFKAFMVTLFWLIFLWLLCFQDVRCANSRKNDLVILTVYLYYSLLGKESLESPNTYLKALEF
jgi:hypothetical protein